MSPRDTLIVSCNRDGLHSRRGKLAEAETGEGDGHSWFGARGERRFGIGLDAEARRADGREGCETGGGIGNVVDPAAGDLTQVSGRISDVRSAVEVFVVVLMRCS